MIYICEEKRTVNLLDLYLFVRAFSIKSLINNILLPLRLLPTSCGISALVWHVARKMKMFRTRSLIWKRKGYELSKNPSLLPTFIADWLLIDSVSPLSAYLVLEVGLYCCRNKQNCL